MSARRTRGPLDRPEVRRVAEDLTALLVPRLFAELHGVTLAFEELALRLERAPETALRDEAALGRADRERDSCRELGWCLGVLSAAVGANLLCARRERRGLEPLVSQLEEALQEEGLALIPRPRALPAVGTALGEGWEAPFAFAALFFFAARERGESAPLAWYLEGERGGWRLGVSVPAQSRRRPGAWQELLEGLAHLLPGSTFSLDDRRAELCLAPGWLVDDED